MPGSTVHPGIRPRRPRPAGRPGNLTCLLLAALVAVAGLAVPRPAPAQEVERIAAIVNEDVISTSDVSARLGLSLLASGLPATPENRERLRPQVLRSLIDESLQRQEARQFEIEADEAEVEAAIETIASNNGVDRATLFAALDQAEVPERTLYDQVRTTLAWRELVRARLVPQVSVSDDDVDARLADLSRTVGLTEYLVAEIFLEAANPGDSGEVFELANQLAQEIRGGANFPAVARQFSQSPTAAANGDLGWVTEGQLAPELDEALGRMAPGTLSEPIQAPGGVYLLLLRDRRVVTPGDPAEAEVEVASLTVRLPRNASQATADRMMDGMRTIQETVEGCAALESAAASLTGAQPIERRSGQVATLPPALAQRVANAPVGAPTGWQMLPTNDGATLHMVCERETQSLAEIDRDRIRQAIAEERVNRLASRYLRDLRNQAYIELRG
jgi:peptidyl-prolyl cis-trans isomerase SurA